MCIPGRILLEQTGLHITNGEEACDWLGVGSAIDVKCFERWGNGEIRPS